MSVIDESLVREVRLLLNKGRNTEEIVSMLNVSKTFVLLARSQLEHYQYPLDSPDKVMIAQVLQEREVGDIPIGCCNDSVIYWNPFTSVNPHVLGVGASGVGKTYFNTGLACELNLNGLSVILIDYSNSYELKKFPRGHVRNNLVREVQVGRNGLALNLLEIRRESDVRGPESVASRMAGSIHRSFPKLGERQEEVIYNAFLAAYRKKGIVREDNDSWDNPPPLLADFYNELENIGEDEESADRKYAQSARSHIHKFFRSNLFTPSGELFSWKQVMEASKTTILQLNGLEDRTKLLLTDMLLGDLFTYASSQGEQELRCFVGIDEAHTLGLHRNQNEDSPLLKILREGRKFGLGAILASQRPKDFNGIVFDNTATKITMQLSDLQGEFVKNVAEKSKKSVREIRKTISNLPKGNAYALIGDVGKVCRVLTHEERGLM